MFHGKPSVPEFTEAHFGETPSGSHTVGDAMMFHGKP